MTINQINYLDLNELISALDKEGIRYRYFKGDDHPFIKGPVIYVSALDQIAEPTRKQRETFVPYIRVTKHANSHGYYVRDTGMILEHVKFENLIKMIRNCVNEGSEVLRKKVG